MPYWFCASLDIIESLLSIRVFYCCVIISLKKFRIISTEGYEWVLISQSKSL